MNLSDYLSKPNIDLTAVEFSSSHSLAKKIVPFDKETNIELFDIAILGVPEDRGSKNIGSAKAPDIIRKKLYSLSDFFPKLKIVDLGNITQGKKLKDTNVAIQQVVSQILNTNATLIIIGGTQNITFPCFKAFHHNKKFTNIVSIDSRFDLGTDDELDLSLNVTKEIIKTHSKYLLDYFNIGYQSYFVSPEDVELLKDKLSFDSIRLGIARTQMKNLEPHLRDANLISFDISSVASSYAQANIYASPNGFTGDEACQISKYAGLSDNANVFGIFEINPDLDNNEQTSLLAAQMIWYFFEGFSNRRKEEITLINNNIQKYIVKLENEYSIVFYKSIVTERWWIEIPYQKIKNRQLIIACSEDDYVNATNHEIPDRWLKAFQKIN